MREDKTLPAADAGPVDWHVRHGALVLVHDDVSDRLDEMADLCEHWKRWREGRGHTPQAIRAALVVLAHEVAMLADMEQKHGPRTRSVGRA